MARTCRGKNNRGAPCTAPAGANGFCYFHDPAQGKTRAEARKRGGLHRAARKIADAPGDIVTIQDILRTVNAVIADTWQQDNSAQRSRALLAACDIAIKVLQASELSERVAALEYALGQRPEVKK